MAMEIQSIETHRMDSRTVNALCSNRDSHGGFTLRALRSLRSVISPQSRFKKTLLKPSTVTILSGKDSATIAIAALRSRSLENPVKSSF